MARLEYFLVAESISVDKTTNRISLFNVLEEMQQVSRIEAKSSGLAFSLGVPQMVAVSSWILAEDDLGKTFDVTLAVTIPGCPEPLTQPIQFCADRRRQRVIQTLIGCPIKGAGNLSFEVLLNGTHAAKHVISVSIAEPPPAPPDPPDQKVQANP